MMRLGLIQILLRMSAHTIRERRKLRLKIAAATSEGWPRRLTLLARMARSAIWSKVSSSRRD